MRLRSLTKHVKDQNWFAVALDFFIVGDRAFPKLVRGFS